MAQSLKAPTTQDFLQKTLGAQLAAGATSAATLNNTTGIQNLPGVMIVDRVDTNGNETPSKVEVILFSATSGSTVTTLTRGQAGTSDQAHEINAVVEFSPDVMWAQSVYDALTQLVVASTGVVDTTKVVTPSGSQTLTNKTLTSPVLNTGVSGTAIVDEDNMASDSATKVPTQQSVKAYVDTAIAGVSSTVLTTTAKARAVQTGAQSITTATDTKITFDSETFDPGNNFNLSTDQFTAPTTGYYWASGGVHMASSIADLHCYLVVTGTSGGNYMGTRNTGQSTNVSQLIFMTAGDTLELHMYHTAGSSINTSNAYNSPFLSVHLISV